MGKKVLQSVDEDLKQYGQISPSYPSLDAVNEQLADIASYVDASTFGILPNGTGIVDKLSSAIQTLKTNKKVALYFSKEGEYVLDKSLTIRNDVMIVCKNKNITFKVSPTFVLQDDFVIKIQPLDGNLLSVTLKNFVIKIDGISGHTLSAKETVVYKIIGVKSFIYDGSEVRVTNSGLALKTTCLDFRTTFDNPLVTTNDNILITNAYLQNESGASAGGLVFVRETCNNVTIKDSTFIKNGADEYIVFFQAGTKKNINIYNNDLVYTDVFNVDGTKIITIESYTTSTANYENVYIFNNRIKVYHTVQRLICFDMVYDYCKNVVIENNYIELFSSCINECLSVFDLQLNQINGETIDTMWGRLDITIRNNKIIANSTNQRSILWAKNCKVDFIGNRVSGIIQQGLVYINASAGATLVSTKVNAIGNLVEGLKFLATLTGFTDSAYLFFKDNKIKGVPQIFTNGVPKVFLDYYNNFTDCTSGTVFINRYANTGGEINLKDNTFVGSTCNILYADNTYFTDLFNMVNNLFKTSTASQVFAGTITVNTKKFIAGNTYSDGTDNERATTIPANLQTMYQTGKLVSVITDTTITRNVKKTDGTWTTL